MSEESWIEEHRYISGNEDLLRRMYRAVVDDLISTGVERATETSLKRIDGWPLDCNRDFALAGVLHTAIRFAQELSRTSAMSNTRRTKAEHELIAALREFQRRDQEWLDEERGRTKPTPEQQAARDAWQAERLAAMSPANRKAQLELLELCRAYSRPAISSKKRGTSPKPKR